MFDLQVKKIVEGSFKLFQSMYMPLIQEHVSDGLLSTSPHGKQAAFKQVSIYFSSGMLLYNLLPFYVSASSVHNSDFPPKVS